VLFMFSKLISFFGGEFVFLFDFFDVSGTPFFFLFLKNLES
jgi:hypothetical protein